MKKIISALTIGAMVAGAAFADVSLNLNYRQRAAMYANYSMSGKDDITSILNLDAYSGAGTDNFAASLSGDIASFDITLVGDETTEKNIRAKTLGANVFIGPVTLFGGFWADGKLNGAYRTKSDIDAGNLEGMDFEFKKLGSAFTGSPCFFIDNYAMPVQVTASESYVAGASVKVPGIDNGALTVNASYISNETSDEKGSKSSGSLMGHTVAVVADGRLDNIGQAEVVFKYGQLVNFDTAMAFGVIAQPTLVKNLISTIGFSGAMIDGDFSDYAIDLRLRYQAIPKKLSITSFHSYSAIQDAKNMVAKLNGKGNATTKGLADAYPTKDEGTYGKMGGSAISRDAVMANNLMIRYNVNSTLSVFGIVADMYGFDESEGKDTEAILQLRASIWAQLYADANNSVCIGFVYAQNDVTNDNKAKCTSMAVPVVIRVKM